MAEWSIAAVLKTVDLHGSGGSNPSLSASSGKIARLTSCESFFCQTATGKSIYRWPFDKKSKSRLCRYSCYFSACKLRSKGKGDRREPIPPVSQLPPVGEIDAFLQHKSGCKKASTYGKTHFASGCGGQKARHFRIFSRVPLGERSSQSLATASAGRSLRSLRIENRAAMRSHRCGANPRLRRPRRAAAALRRVGGNW